MALEVPLSIQPMEAVPVGELPKGDDWLFEPKYDGFRCILFRDDDSVHLQSRRQRPLGRYFPEVIEAARVLPIRRFVFDGELIIPDQPFDTLQLRLHPRNLTPGEYGLPEGLTEDEFVKVMRTGEDIHCEKFKNDPICALGPDTPLLQVIPWPTYHSMTDAHLIAIYTYLAALPPATACNTVANGCPGFSGGAIKSATYVYPNTRDCPNPAPPQ